MISKRVWAEIDLDALKSNINAIRAITDKEARIMAVVKADAYGHGVLPVSRTLLDAGVTHLAVATVDEGIELRNAGINVPILLLGTPFLEDAPSVVKYHLSACITDFSIAEALSEAAQEMGEEASLHIKIDTGMGRLGFLSRGDVGKIVSEIMKISELPKAHIDGVFTHFARADEASGKEATKLQFCRFMDVCDALRKRGLTGFLRHCANSAAIMDYPEYHLDMVRPGIILYGCYPSDEVDKKRLPLKPVMALKSRITHIKTLEKGEGISYGGTYQTKETTRIATVSVGYADGLSRSLSGQLFVAVRGQKVPVLGRICMDQCMIDVSSVQNISVGDEVTLFGGTAQSATDMANILHTISYEILCDVSVRVPRIYI